ncbi:type III pantothenate kinase [Caminibacter sp.]
MKSEKFWKLVDIGNTYVHIFDGEIKHLRKPIKLEGDVFYISVNEEKEKEFLKLNPNAVNLKKYVKFKTLYSNTLGIDRIMACKTIKDGVVVDAGSFITLDVMEDGLHLGGVIMPGLYKLKEIFAKNSVLNKEFVYPTSIPPKNTAEAVNEGSVGMVVEMIKKYSINKKIYFTGGDGEFLAKILNGIYIKDLVFRGMIKTIKEDYDNSFAKR